jgi:hypothetical protein
MPPTEAEQYEYNLALCRDTVRRLDQVLNAIGARAEPATEEATWNLAHVETLLDDALQILKKEG